jgi:hypothetical protein
MHLRSMVGSMDEGTFLWLVDRTITICINSLHLADRCPYSDVLQGATFPGVLPLANMKTVTGPIIG